VPGKGLPPALIESLRGVAGFEEMSFCRVHEESENFTSVRLNPSKLAAVAVESALQNWLQLQEKIPWCEWGRWLPERPSFIMDPCWHAGAYYVQEASSMFLWHALKQLFPQPGTRPLRILDLCAAPGGKSTLLAAYFQQDCIVANEAIRSRVNVLTENITRWGATNLFITNNDARDFERLRGFFDLIVVDAPCSGSGLFRRDPEAVTEWSPQHVKLCSERQKRILHDVLPALAENGKLIYSTCSYSKTEDEDILDWLVQEEGLGSLPLTINNEWGIVPSFSDETEASGYRFFPDKVKGEGFFVGCLEKRLPAFEEEARLKRPKKWGGKGQEPLKNWLKDPEKSLVFERSDHLVAVPVHLENEYLRILEATKLWKGGILLGKMAGDDLVPDHEFALSGLASESVPVVEISLPLALQYLKRESFDPGPLPKGWALVAYEGLKLGWIKVLGNRINNYYPASWRIIRGS
jgi:NOL1/NOP2/sun family putative RNA methylase